MDGYSCTFIAACIVVTVLIIALAYWIEKRW